MEDGKSSRLAEVLRRLTTSVERVITEEAASSAVRGAADGLREELPALADELRGVLRQTLDELRDSARDGLAREDTLLSSTARVVAGAVTEGTLEHLEREWKNGGLPLHDVALRLNELLDRALGVMDAHRFDLLEPGARARKMSAEVVATAIEQISTLEDELRELLPILEEVGRQMGRGMADGAITGAEARLGDLSAGASLVSEEVARGLTQGAIAGAEPRLGALSDAVGRGLVRGMITELREQMTAENTAEGERALRAAGHAVAEGAWSALSAKLKRPLMIAGGAMTALVAAVVLVPRRH